MRRYTTSLLLIILLALNGSNCQMRRRVGRLQEVFAWKQITFNIGGQMVLQDRFGSDGLDLDTTREKRQSDRVVFDNNDDESERNWNQSARNNQSSQEFGRRPRPPPRTNRPTSTSTTTSRPNGDANSFFIQYNNLPMGVERVGNRLFVTLPRRRYGIPSTLNYLDLTQDSHSRSPGLRPYPDLRRSRSLTSVYRTRADECGRLWMVDTGLLEIPDNRQQVQQPAIVAYDLNTNRQIFRYPLKETDIISATTPTGLASITIDIVNGDCSNAYAYIPDLATYGLIVYSLRQNDSWRLSHNYFSFDPNAGNLNIAGQRFQWNDGIFSITLTEPRSDSCRTAYFHAMVGTNEYSVSTCLLRNSTASQDSNYWAQYSLVGNRGANSQSTMHGYHPSSNVVLFADIARSGLSCWNAGSVLSSTAVAILASDSTVMIYPSDLHVNGDEVWLMANSLPTWVYSTLDTNQYNFFIYRGNIPELIAGTVCASSLSPTNFGLRSGTDEATNNEETNV